MTSPWGAILAGLGAGAGEIGQSMTERQLREAMMALTTRKENDANRRADFTQNLALREAGYVPQSELADQTTQNIGQTDQAGQALKKIALQMAGSQMSPSMAGTSGADPTQDSIPALQDISPNSAGPWAGSAQRGGQLSDAMKKIINVPTIGGDEPWGFDYSSSRQARQQQMEAAKQDAEQRRQQANEAARRPKAEDVAAALNGDVGAKARVLALEPTLRPAFDPPIRNIDPNSAAGIAAAGQKAKAAAQAAAQYGVVQSVDENGQTTYVRRSEAPGQQAAGGAGGDSRAKTQIAVAANQAVKADHDMTMFENRVLSGDATITPFASEMARKAYANTLGSSYAEKWLNDNAPDLAMYVKSAKAIGIAERLITPRGGSNFLTQGEVALAGIGPSPNKGQIDQSRGYRSALVGGLRSHITGSPIPPTPDQTGKPFPEY